MKRNLPHLPISDFETTLYTKPNTPIEIEPLPPKNRQSHSRHLQQQLANAWANADNDEVVYHTNRNGIYLEFKGEQGHELITKSLESKQGQLSNWSRLLNVRTEILETSEGSQETIIATVYIPKSKKEKFFEKIEEYATENTVKNNPKHAPLLTSISNIRKALEIESFWTDNKNLIPSAQPQWCEVWLSSDQQEIIQNFEDLLLEQKIVSKPGAICFPERAVKVVHVNQEQLTTITLFSDDIAEYRRAKETTAFWLDQNNQEQAEWVQDIRDRLKISPDSKVAICILDTGVNNGHILLAPILKTKDCQSVNLGWGTYDHDKHGTLMAGIAGYGDLQEILTSKEIIRLKHCLESVKILPQTVSNNPDLWGAITSQAISLAEIQSPDKKRISCMAITANDTRDRGKPSSWSSALDKLCSGSEDDVQRLFIVSAGNITDLNLAKNYPNAQLTDSIHDPAQSWNALTVGAYTELDTIVDLELKNYTPIAPKEGLSPFTTTSLVWENKWPIKPEIVMEGGNLGKDTSNFITECDDLSLLSTHFQPTEVLFAPFNMTSASTAQAAWFAAQIQAEHPDYWPETIRALMIHSATWTDTLKQQFLVNENKGSYAKLLRICGYGVPNLEKALYSASNSLTLIAQSELQPFAKKESGGYRTNDMHLYELPWPKQTLLNLPAETEIQMRITLSYFIEPGPGEIGYKDRYRYASHGLRFQLNSPTETKEQLMQRINISARDENNIHPGTSSASDHWTLGSIARSKGSIHSDIWAGSPQELAASNLVAIYPVIGWWRERSHLGKFNNKTRYSLIVSIYTPEQDIDVYTPVAIQLGIKVPVPISV